MMSYLRSVIRRCWRDRDLSLYYCHGRSSLTGYETGRAGKALNTKARVWNNKDDSAFDALFFPMVSVSLSCNDAWFLLIPGLHYKPLSLYLLFLDDRPVSFLRFHFPFFKLQCFTTFLYLNFVIFICFPFVALKKKNKTIPALMYVCGFLFFSLLWPETDFNILYLLSESPRGKDRPRNHVNIRQYLLHTFSYVFFLSPSVAFFFF